MNVHSRDDLRQMQSLPLEAKILMSKQRIRQWYDHWDGMVYVSFSGGKDSTVLKHLVENTPGVYDVPSLFVNTGLEYPEIQRFAMSQPNVITVRPEMRFDEVLRVYGYPVISKRVSGYIATAKRNPNSMRAKWIRGEEPTKFVSGGKYTYLIDSPFQISSYCCDAMKKRPAKKYAKESGRHPMTGQMACESVSRENEWRKNGCNGFDMKNPISNPMAFWTEQDVLLYLKKYNVPYCSVYGDIVSVDDEGNEYDMPTEYMEALAAADAMPRLKTTGCDRTGCIFCMFGCHLEGAPNRFQRLKGTHPRQYEYCINGGEFVTEWFEFTPDGQKIKTDCEPLDGKAYIFERRWQPSKDGLGLGKVLDYIGVDYK